MSACIEPDLVFAVACWVFPKFGFTGLLVALVAALCGAITLATILVGAVQVLAGTGYILSLYAAARIPSLSRPARRAIVALDRKLDSDVPFGSRSSKEA